MTGLRKGLWTDESKLELKSLGIEQAEHMKQTFLHFRKLY